MSTIGGAACYQGSSDNSLETKTNAGSLSIILSSPSLPNSLPPFLTLPGEIRNHIYRDVLVPRSPFAVKLQFTPRDTALLRVNKQVFREASAIFYHESTFRIPECLFVGAPILQQMENFYHLPKWKLKSMKHLVIDVPVYAWNSDPRLKDQTSYNLNELAYCLLPPLGQDPHELKVQLELKPAWGETTWLMDPEYYWPLLNSAALLRGRGVDVQVHVHTHPTYLDAWVDVLAEHWGNDWSLKSSLKLGNWYKLDFDTIERFSARYQVEGVKEYHTETWDSWLYTFSPRRMLPS